MGYIIGLELLLAINNLIEIRFFIRYGFKLDRSKYFFESQGRGGGVLGERLMQIF